MINDIPNISGELLIGMPGRRSGTLQLLVILKTHRALEYVFVIFVFILVVLSKGTTIEEHMALHITDCRTCACMPTINKSSMIIYVWFGINYIPYFFCFRKHCHLSTKVHTNITIFVKWRHKFGFVVILNMNYILLSCTRDRLIDQVVKSMIFFYL